MRPIKFRHWGGKYGMKYFTFKDITMTFDYREGGEPAFAYIIHDDGIPLCIDCDDKNHTIMQFTGLKDKNGKEIFEGDRLYDGEYEYIVLFKNGAFIVENEIPTRRDGEMVTCEVIGNIYENPELSA